LLRPGATAIQHLPIGDCTLAGVCIETICWHGALRVAIFSRDLLSLLERGGGRAAKRGGHSTDSTDKPTTGGPGRQDVRHFHSGLGVIKLSSIEPTALPIAGSHLEMSTLLAKRQTDRKSKAFRRKNI
jgi:hypothetical protein